MINKMTEEWQRQKGELGKSFAYFKIYRDLGATRTHEKVIDKIETERRKEQDIEKTLPIPTLNQLAKLSAKWEWVNRTIAYDNFIDTQQRLQKEEAYLQLEPDLIGTGENILFAVKDIVQELKQCGDTAPSTRANSLDKASRAYSKAVYNLRLLHGRSTEIKDNKVEAHVEADVSADVNNKVKNVFTLSDEELDEILTIDDSQEDFTDDI